MAASYILTFSDPANTNNVVVQSTTDGPGINNYDTSLDLVGAGYQNYGLPTAQNFLKLLENFAGPNQPLHPVKGQLWYDTSAAKPVLRINNGQITSAKWPSANGIYQQTSDPVIRFSTNIVEGDVWVDTLSTQLKIRAGGNWVIVGPSVQVGTAKTGSEVVQVESTTGTLYPIIKNWVNGKVVEIISYNAFTPRTVIDGFATVKIGTNLTTKVIAKYNGLAEKASALALSSGVLIQASEVLKNNATSQTLAGTLIIESASGLSVRQSSTSPLIKLYSNSTNAYVNFVNTSTASILEVGVGTPGNATSYLKFNSEFRSVGVNKPPGADSPALDVAGGARVSGIVNITTSSVIALSVGGGALFGNDVYTTGGLRVDGQTTSTGKLTVGTPNTSTSGPIIVPAYDDIFDIGEPNKKFQNVYASDIHAKTFYGDLEGTATNATSLVTPRLFDITGQVTAVSTSFNGTSAVTFLTTLSRTAIAEQTTCTTATSNHTLLVLDTSTTSTSLEKISKSNFLSDVYPGLFVTGMITAFGTSTSIPSGFLLCDNSSVSQSTYSGLYAVIGTSYGGGIGTFRVPNMTTSTSIAGGSYLTYIIKT
jgi:hypothetical protein